MKSKSSNLPRIEANARAVELLGLLDGIARRFMLRPARCDGDDIPLSRQEIRVLITLDDDEALPMGMLARRLVVSISRLTALIDRLTAMGLVERRRSEQDRRVVRIGLTALGRKRREHGRLARLAMAEAMLAALDDSERGRFLALMRKIGDRASGSVAGGDKRDER